MRSKLLGTKKKDHKYILRVENGGKGNYRYFYTQEEVDAYKKAQKEQKPKETTQTKDDKLGFFIPVPSSWLPDNPWWTSFITPSTPSTPNPLNPTNPNNPLEPYVPKRTLSPKDPMAPDRPTPKATLPDEITPGKYPKTENAQAVDYWSLPFSDEVKVRLVDRKKTPNRNIPPEVAPEVREFLDPIVGYHSMDDDQLATNPNYTERAYTDKEWYTNCQNCTYAFVMRRRGFDVTAASHDMQYNGSIHAANQVFVNPTVTTMNNNPNSDEVVDNLISEMIGYGEGAYGELAVFWKRGGGHSLVWSVEGGNVLIRDAQTGDIYNSVSALKTLFKDVITTDNKSFDIVINSAAVVGNPTIIRLDDCDVTDEILKHVKPNNVSHSEDVNYLSNCIFAGMEWALQHGL